MARASVHAERGRSVRFSNRAGRVRQRPDDPGARLFLYVWKGSFRMMIDVNGIAFRFDPGANAATDPDADGRLHVMVSRENAGVLAAMFRHLYLTLKDNEATEVVIPGMELHPGRRFALALRRMPGAPT